MTTPVSADDRMEIHDLLMAYVHASDTGDIDAYAATFAADGVLLTSGGERYAGTQAIREHARHSLHQAGKRGRQHYFQQMRVAREGDAIRVFSYWMVADMTSQPRAARVRSMGTCDDLCIRAADGTYRFAERKIAPWTDTTAPWKG